MEISDQTTCLDPYFASFEESLSSRNYKPETLTNYRYLLRRFGRLLVQAGVADIGIAGAPHSTASGSEQLQIGGVELIPVASPQHAPTRNQPKLPGEARQHRQLVLTVRSSFTESEDIGVFGNETRRLTDLGAKHALLPAGSSWGFMPEPIVPDDLASARLVLLDLPKVRGGLYPLHAIYRTQTPPGPAATWTIQHFVCQTKC